MCAGRRCNCYHGEPWDGLTSEIRDAQNKAGTNPNRGMIPLNASLDVHQPEASGFKVGRPVNRTDNPDTRRSTMFVAEYLAPDDAAFMGTPTFARDGVVPGTLAAGTRQGIGRKLEVPKTSDTPRGSMSPQVFYPSRRRPIVESLGEVTAL